MRSSPAIALILGLTLAAPVGAENAARFVSRLDLPRDVDGFGGLSGLELSGDGTRFAAISDRGALFRGRIERRDGALAAVSADQALDMTEGAPQPIEPGEFDTEGLAIAPDGGIYVSYEGRNRVVAYDADTFRATELPRPPEFDGFQGNSGLEALAVNADGDLYTLPERSGHPRRAFPVWRFADGAWSRAGEVPRMPPYLPVGADFGPDGRLYLLERHFTGIAFRSRVRSFAVDDTGLSDQRIELETANGEHGNLEGIAAWRDPEGAIRLTMVADDNFLSFQWSEMVDYVLPLASTPQTH